MRRRILLILTILSLSATTAVSVGWMQAEDYDVTLSGPPLFQDTLHFRIHYTLIGTDAVTPQYVTAVAQALEKAWQVQVDLLGWSPPPPDAGRGGNDLYDVFLKDLTEEDALGIASPEDIIGDNPLTPKVEEWAATSYLMIENDFDDMSFSDGQDVFTLMRATVAHEFSHAIQFGYDYADAHDWIYEATAVWMETQTVGTDQDATGYVASTYDYPELCFGSIANVGDSDLHYGEWLFIDHLAQEFGADFVRQLWDYVADYEGFEALERIFEDHGTSLVEVFVTYRLRNLARDYRLADLFDATVWLEDTIDDIDGWTYNGVGIEELGANYFAVEIPPGLYSVEIVGDDDALTLWSIGIDGHDVDVFQLDRHGVFNAGKYEYQYLMIFNPTYDEDLGECESSTYDLRFRRGGNGLKEIPRLFRQFGGALFAKLETGWD